MTNRKNILHANFAAEEIRRMCGLTPLALICFALTVAGADQATLAARAERAFEQAKADYRKSQTVENAVRFARHAFEFAEFAARDSQREHLANEGITAARAVIRVAPTNAAAHYWLAMNIGQVARTKSLGALKLIRQIEEGFLRARELDPKIDHAGPDRALGTLYRDAPGWPTSVGNRKKAREHFEQALRIAPEFPDNQIAFLEAMEKWGDRGGFDRQMATTERVMNEARDKFKGEDWDASWRDWEKRFNEMKTKTGGVGRSTPPKGAHQQ